MSPTVVQPVLVARARGLLGVVVVLERRAALRPHRARLAGRELVAGVVEDVRRAQQRLADRPAVGEPVLGVDRRQQIDLGGRVVLVDDRPEPLDHRRLDVRRTRRRGVDDRAQRRQVTTGARLFRQPQQPHEHRRDHLRRGDAVALDQLERPIGVEAVHHHRRPAQPVHGHVEAQRRRVVERCRREVDRVRTEAVEALEQRHDRRRRPDRGERQRRRDRLRAPRRPRRVQEIEALALVLERRRRALGDQGVVVAVDRRRRARGPAPSRRPRRPARPWPRSRTGSASPSPRGCRRPRRRSAAARPRCSAALRAGPPTPAPDSADGSPSAAPRRCRAWPRGRAADAPPGASARSAHRRRPSPRCAP